MSTTLIVVVAIVIVIVVVAAVALIARTAQRRNRLRRQFGPEYDRTVEASGKRSEAEGKLLNRQDRIDDMDIRPLDPAARDTYHAEWARVQERFVDTPEDALSDADQLVRRVMADRGYETQGYEQRVADLSVEHARTLEHYRTAHDISARAANKEASTEELRQAMIHYRALFEDLLDGSPGGTARATTETEGDPSRTAADRPGAPREG